MKGSKMIRQTIPEGMVESPLSERDLDALKIAHKKIVTDWQWRHNHANPLEAIIITKADFPKAKLTADYYVRLQTEKAAKRAAKAEQARLNSAPPQAVVELYKSRLARLPLKKSGNARHKLHLKINRMKREWPQFATL